MQNNRVLGYVFLGLGVMVGLFGAAWGAASISSGTLEVTGFLLLLLILAPIEAMLIGAGVFILRSSSSEMAEMVEVKRQRKILSALQTQGRLSLSEAALEVDATLDQVKQDVYDLVGKGLFSGYIDWQDGILYSRQARALRDAGSCPNCNGKLELAGKGVIKCPYCDTEIFL